ncbi:MAG: trehalose-6-phosphate synthase, partial [Thermoleophilaceae bacterium]|nr:trehalose-6-phosphate synthase [Thermoleophilaceae bacterium]
MPRPDSSVQDAIGNAPLVLVSNRGPVTFDLDEDGARIKRRGTGGLVTALAGLVNHRTDTLWVASAMTSEDAVVSAEHGDQSFIVSPSSEAEYRVRLVVSDDQAYDRFYNVVANPLLWFIQHYLWDLSNAPDIRQEEIDAFHQGYQVVNQDLASAVLEEIEGLESPIVMVHDYHLYTMPAMIREARPDVFLHHFVHIPWTQPDAWRVLPTEVRNTIYRGILANDIIGFHTRSYQRNFLLCCRELLEGAEVDEDAGRVIFDDHETWVRAYPLPIDSKAFLRTAQNPRVHEFEREIIKRRRENLILRVDRADLSKNVLRGFTAFDLFLTEHQEFIEK